MGVGRREAGYSGTDTGNSHLNGGPRSEAGDNETDMGDAQVFIGPHAGMGPFAGAVVCVGMSVYYGREVAEPGYRGSIDNWVSQI